MNNTKMNIKYIVFTYFIVLMPIINQYQVVGFRIIEIFAILGMFFMFLYTRMRIQINGYVKFAIYGLIVSVISSTILVFLHPDMVSIFTLLLRWIKYIVVILGIVVAANYFLQIELAIEIYKRVVIIACMILMIQIFLHFVANINLFFIIPNTTLNYNSNMTSDALLIMLNNRISMGFPYRASSFFIEPAYFSIYVLPMLALLLLGNIKNRDILLSLFITVSLLLSSSSIGIVGSIVIWIGFIFKIIRERKISTKIVILVPFIIILTVLILPKIINTDSFQFSLRTKLEALKHLSVGSSLTLRLLRGLFYYLKMEIFYKLWGVGYGNLSSYYHITDMNLVLDSANMEVAYMNGVQEILCTYGIIGVCIFIIWFIKIFKKNEVCGAIGIAMILIMVGSEYYDTASYFLSITLMLCASKYEKGQLLNTKRNLK